MIKVFPETVLIEMDSVLETINGVKVISKTKRKNHKGKIISGEGFDEGDHVLFFAKNGVILEGKCLINRKDVVLILKKEGMKLLGNRILVEAEKSSSKLTDKLVASDAHIQILPIGIILALGDKIDNDNLLKAYYNKERIMFDKDRATDLSIYELPDIKGRPVFMINESDVLSII
jgi:co-chaperonin GroES (HSP10)